ncbi:MAG TPA: pepsin/retropepsin-like aspartic protease family protein [Pyrinomonadaceae bacterium]
MKNRVLAIPVVLSLLLTIQWAAPLASGAAHSSVYDRFLSTLHFASNAPEAFQQRDGAGIGLPAPARLHEADGRGLLVQTWVNGTGPFEFAVDTGAGANILSRRVASAARVEVETGGGAVRVVGLSGVGAQGARKAHVRNFALGARGNLLPSQGFTIIADGLPAGVDGVLDPTESFSPLGYRIDMPNETISAFDPRLTPLRSDAAPADGTVARWLTEPESRRPYVMLAQGRRALIDTGSGFGLAVNRDAARSLGIFTGEGRERVGTRDLGGGDIPSRRIRPATVHVGSLALRNVPTDYLSDAGAGAPVLLGRDALRPFELSFDPVNRLIRFKPV